MNLHKTLRIKLCIFTAALLMILGLVPVKVLVLQDETGKVVFKQRVVDGTEFTYRFFHSFDKDWVEETFVIRDSCFNITRHRFRAFSYDAREHTFPGDFYFADGYGVVENIEQYHESRMEKMDIRVARTVVQYLIIGGKQYAIHELSQPGFLLTLKIKWQSRFHFYT